MVASVCVFIGSLSLAASSALTDGGCSIQMQKSLHEAKRIVDSLRLDKTGEMHVYAIGGREYTDSHAREWIFEQLQKCRQSEYEHETLRAR
jgi:hypothetical protein